MKKQHLLIICLYIVALSCGLSSCGKVSAPSPYSGSGYPHSYPRH